MDGILTQIPSEDMSAGDCIYKFLTHLPEELYMQLIHHPDQEMSAYYSTARMWEGLRKIPQQIVAASCTGFGKPHKRPQPPSSLSQFDTPTTMPYLPLAAPPPMVTELMDLDVMAVAWDPHKMPSTIRCYNCNEFGHLVWDCWKPQCHQTPSTENRSFRGRPWLTKPMHLFEDIEEEGYASSDEEEYVPEEFNPDKPDPELQYMDANIMEEGEILEEAEADDWRPVSPDDYYQTSASISASTSPKTPLEAFNIVLSRLPIYGLEAGPPKANQSEDTGMFTPVRTIFDTGVESNYITACKAQVAGTQIYPITVREIVGAG